MAINKENGGCTIFLTFMRQILTTEQSTIAYAVTLLYAIYSPREKPFVDGLYSHRRWLEA